MNVLKNYIGGEWLNSSSPQTINVINPANQDILAEVPFGSSTAIDVAAACESSINAQK